MNRVSSVSTADLIDAKLEEHQICGAMQCPSCGHKLDRKPNWVGLPAGVKFDPTDQELIEHLEAKVLSEEDTKSHPLIDEFIPTIEGEDGICYTHPEKLPVNTFFHRPSKAYTTGTRKRRKIQTECDDLHHKGETRWHKTGKTRPVMILVLYTNFGKHRKPEKTNWVMHQYHLGELEEEKDGELVVSKIFYQTQPRQCNWTTTASGPGSTSANYILTTNSKTDNNLRFDEVGMGETANMVQSETTAGEEYEEQQQLREVAFHVSRPTDPISAVISPATLHQTSISTLDDPFTMSRILLQVFYMVQQQQRMVERSGSGLEDVIMGCTSTDNKGEPSMQHSQEPEWLKYSSYWLPDNPDHHG
ncbi:hypothetical protein J5N97_025892 [Dioscorea zingiberensis]|uniref:NAC domain-containing protein n=1 Tax=Dioscorea zingiberensis TaxID=325984 RepID=A0A9D5C1L3_9LILI|nr:hypothetical protein J5N97_025892 [Dioscorea zingiberensis]